MNTIVIYILSIIIGSVVGFISGFQGIAGGFYISMLLLASGIVKTQRMAAGTTLLAVLFPISIGAVYEYWKSGDVDIPVAIIVTVFYTIFAWVGAKVNVNVDEKHVFLSLACLLLLTSGYFFHKYYALTNDRGK